MTSQNSVANKKIVRQFFEYFQAGEHNKIESELLDKNYKLHFPGTEKPLGISESLELMKTYNTAFPDLKFTVECQIAEGDFVVTRIKGEGTHKGEFQGTAATNKEIHVSSISIHRIKNEKINEEWTEVDALRMLQQIGAMPEITISQNHH